MSRAPAQVWGWALAAAALIQPAAAQADVSGRPEREAPRQLLSFATTTPGGMSMDMASAGKGPRLTWAVEIPQTVYHSPVQRERAAPLVVGQRLYVATSRQTGVLIYDRSSGVLLSRIETVGTVEAAPIYDAETGDLFVADTEGMIYRFDPEGEARWSYEADEAILTSVTVGEGQVFFRTVGDQVGAISAEDGSWIWSYGREAPPDSTILGTSKVALAGGHAVAGFADGAVVALSLEDGTVAWEIPLSNPDARWKDVDVAVLLDASCLLLSTYEGPTMCVQPETGAGVWTQEIAAVAEPLVLDDRLILPGLGGKMSAVDRQTGELLWTWEAPKPIGDASFWRQRTTTPVLWGGQAVFGTSRGYVYGLDPMDGTETWSYRPWIDALGFFGAAGVADGSAYLMSGGGYLYHLSPDGFVPPHLETSRGPWVGVLGSLGATDAAVSGHVGSGELGDEVGKMRYEVEW